MRKAGYTVSHYLADRFSELGVRKIFGVPGNHLGPCLSTIKDTSEIQWVGMTNEINAGFAADGYARGNGLGVVGVTYGVGAFSLINTIGGAFVEQVPLVVLNASPTNEQWLNFRALGLLTSHMSPNSESNLNAYRQVTASAQVITNASLAPRQIDAALETCLTALRPVYLEIRENVFVSPCDRPIGRLAPRPRPTTDRNRDVLEQAVRAATEKIENVLGNSSGARKAVVLWGGIEIQRFNLSQALIDLARVTGFPIFTTIMGKSIISEDHPCWHGVYNGKASRPDVYRAFQQAGCKIGLGAWTTSKNLGGTRALGEDWIKADHEGVSVGSRYFPEVKLGDFMKALQTSLEASFARERPEIPRDLYSLLARSSSTSDRQKAVGDTEKHPADLQAFDASYFASEGELPQRLDYDYVIRAVNSLLRREQQRGKSYTIVADAGFSLLSAQNLRIWQPNSFHSQASWLSIGYSVPAAIGFKEASRDQKKPTRVLVFVGDGSFQETCQSLSDHTRLGHNSVIFIFNNQDFYGIEQMLVNPAYFRSGSGEDPDHYNLLHPWHYAELHRVFGSADHPIRGVVVREPADLWRVLETLANDEEDEEEVGPLIVQINLPRKCYPKSIEYKVHEES